MLFISRWLGDSVRLALALCVAILAMQIPAFTHEVLQGLQQVANAGRRDIEQREVAVRSRYNLTADNDAALIAALRPLEPANAASLAVSVANNEAAEVAADRIAAAGPLMQPVAATQAFFGDGDVLRPVVDAAWAGFVPNVAFGRAAVVYGLLGLLLGSLVAHVVLAPFARRREA